MPPDLIVVSDFHLGRGRNPATGRFFPLETFFFDDDFVRFCAFLCTDAAERGRPLRMVLAGDTFDLLRIEPERDELGALTPAVAAARAAAITRAHPGVVAGLASLLEAGHEIVFLPGNHDHELQLDSVQAPIREALLDAVAARAGEQARAAADARLRFSSWFHHEPGRIWIEHGSQYDAEGSFRYPLRRAHDGAPHRAADAERDMPLGNFFQKYLYNGFGAITFIVPSSDANLRYLKWMIAHRPRFLARVIVRHLPFLLQFLRRLGRKAIDAEKRLRADHQEELAALAERSGLGERLIAIDGMKETYDDPLTASRRVARQAAKVVAAGLVTALGSAGLWFAGLHAVNELRVGLGWRTLTFLALNFLFLLLLAIFFFVLLLRAPSSPPRTMPRAAGQIARLIDVPLVVFGHTHEEAVYPLGARSWYYNTGTWIAVFLRDELLPRPPVQFSFLRVRGDDAELLHWSPGRGEPLPVILIDDP